jgi:hypothetical protein
MATWQTREAQWEREIAELVSAVNDELQDTGYYARRLHGSRLVCVYDSHTGEEMECFISRYDWGLTPLCTRLKRAKRVA